MSSPLPGALGRGALRHPVEASLLRGRELAGALSNVQSDRVRRATQLVPDVGPPLGQIFGQLVEHRDRIQRHAEHVQPFEIEPRSIHTHIGLRRTAIRPTAPPIHLPPRISAGANGHGHGRRSLRDLGGAVGLRPTGS